MKKKIIKIVSLLFALSLVTLLVFEIYKFGDTKKLNYIALGDSIAAGQTPYGGFDKSYADFLASYLKKEDKLLKYTKKYSKSGYQTIDVINDIRNKSELKKDLRESDLITISIGANDLLHRLDLENIDDKVFLTMNSEVRNVMPNIDNCIKEIRKYAKEDIVIVGYYNPLPSLFTTAGPAADILFAYIDSEYEKIAKKYDCKYISIYQLFKKNSRFLPNAEDIHPNLEGHKSIANKIEKELSM